MFLSIFPNCYTKIDSYDKHRVHFNYYYKQICKPGSVVNSHLSSTYITICLKPPD